MIAVSSSARSCGLGDGVAALEGALDRAHRAALDDRGAGVGGALGGLRDEVGPDEGDLGAGVAEEVVDLAGLEQRVHRHDDAAGQEDAPVDDGERRHVRQDDGHPVTGLDPVGAQGSCHLGGHAVQLGVGDALAVDPQRGLLGVVLGGLHEVGREVGHRWLLLVRRRWRRTHPVSGCRRSARESSGEFVGAWRGVEGCLARAWSIPLRWARTGRVEHWCSERMFGYDGAWTARGWA